MVRYSFLVRLSHPLLHAGLSRRIVDHLICPKQHRLRDCHSDLLRCFKIDDQLEFDRPLHWQFSGLGAFQNLVYLS
jgi:hypothetical protein